MGTPYTPGRGRLNRRLLSSIEFTRSPLRGRPAIEFTRSPLRGRPAIVLLVSGVLACGCGDERAPAKPHRPTGSGGAALSGCAPGETPLEDGAGCEPAGIPEAAC